MSVQLSPTPVFKAFDNNGAPLFGGQLFTYAAGTTTPQATFTDSTGVTQNTNPIVLNPRGECNLWLTASAAYKLQLQDSFGNIIWTVDNITVSPQPQLITAVKLVNTSITNNATPAFDPELQFALPNAGTYRYSADLYFTAGGSGATPGLKLGVSSTISVITNNHPWNYYGFMGNAAVANGGPQIGTATNLSLDTSGDSLSLQGSFTIATPGRMGIIWCQQNSSANATTVLAGSSLTAIQVG